MNSWQSRRMLPLARPIAAALGLGLLVLVGCSRRPADQPVIAPVSGTVTLDGRPLAKASVVFQSEKGVLSFATTDADGRYELIYIRTDMGAGLGNNTVRIASKIDGPVSPTWKDSIPAIYNVDSTLRVEVKPGGNVFDFNLESKPARK